MKPVQYAQVSYVETCAICTGFICCTFFEPLFLIRDKRIFSFIFLGVGVGDGGCGGADIRRFYK